MKKSQVMKNDEGGVMVKQRVVGEVKRQRWKENVGESVTVVWRRRRSFCFCFFVDSSEKKSLKNKRRDKK